MKASSKTDTVMGSELITGQKSEPLTNLKAISKKGKRPISGDTSSTTANRSSRPTKEKSKTATCMVWL